MIELLRSLLTVLVGFFGVLIGVRQVRIQIRLDFIKQQLKDFYSPLLGICSEINFKSQLRFEIHQKEDEVNKEISDDERISRMGQVSKGIEYNNQQLKTEILPRLNQMLEIFRSNIGLAEVESMQTYEDLTRYIEIWNRGLEGVLAPDVLERIGGHDGKILEDLQRELEKASKKLRDEIKRLKFSII